MIIAVLLLGFAIGAQLISDVDEHDTETLPLYQGTPKELPLYK